MYICWLPQVISHFQLTSQLLTHETLTLRDRLGVSKHNIIPMLMFVFRDSSRVIEQSALDFLSIICDGDARIALNGLQITVQSHLSKGIASEDDMMCKSGVRIRTEDVKAGLQRSHVSYDRTGMSSVYEVTFVIINFCLFTMVGTSCYS